MQLHAPEEEYMTDPRAPSAFFILLRNRASPHIAKETFCQQSHYPPISHFREGFSEKHHKNFPIETISIHRNLHLLLPVSKLCFTVNPCLLVNTQCRGVGHTTPIRDQRSDSVQRREDYTAMPETWGDYPLFSSRMSSFHHAQLFSPALCYFLIGSLVRPQTLARDWQWDLRVHHSPNCSPLTKNALNTQ